MTDKGFNFFDECAARCVHLSPQEEEWAVKCPLAALQIHRGC